MKEPQCFYRVLKKIADFTSIARYVAKMKGHLYAEEISTESDVEQKFVYQLLTKEYPRGLSIPEECIKTKSDIRHLEIGKGKSRKLYYPDYIVTVRGVPLLIVEAKSPQSEVEDGFREARLYATEINSQFDSGHNPLTWIISTNYEDTWVGRWDNEEPHHKVKKSNLQVSNVDFDGLVSSVSYKKLKDQAESFLHTRHKVKFWKPKQMLGGNTVQNKEIGYNYFGDQLSLNFRPLFNPQTLEQRAFIVNNAYIGSERRNRYVDSIDRVLRAATPPSVTDPETIKTSDTPREIIKTLSEPKDLTGELILLVGHVGSGKSTFVDYLREVGLPTEVKSSLLWIEVDLNDAPINASDIYDWVCSKLITNLLSSSNTDFKSREELETLFRPELRDLKTGELEFLGSDHPDYKKEVYTAIKEMNNNPKKKLNALLRHLGAERQRTPLIVLDNADRGVRDEQLLMFQVAKWIQSEFRCISFLPIREQTYDNHKNDPPLDTAIKDLLFRIEAPSFQSVLSRRIDLAIDEMKSNNPNETLSYTTSRGYTVTYKRKDQGSYLRCLKRAVFDYDNFLRNMIIGLAGRNIRKAMEIFLEFCKSGHISDDDIFKIKATNGEHRLSRETLSNVVFRIDKRFFSDGHGYVRNVFKLDKEDDNPSHFIRYSILIWLKSMEDKQGPIGVEGFHKAKKMISELNELGFAPGAVEREIHELLASNCIVAEHLRTDKVGPEDLIHIGPAGDTHLAICSNAFYLSAVSEDTWLSSKKLARSISKRISGVTEQFSERNQILNSNAFVEYLEKASDQLVKRTTAAVSDKLKPSLIDISDIKSNVYSTYNNSLKDDPWLYIKANLVEGDVIDGIVDGTHRKHGLFVTVHESEQGDKANGLLHRSKLDDNYMSEWSEGDCIRVAITQIKVDEEKVGLALPD